MIAKFMATHIGNALFWIPKPFQTTPGDRLGYYSLFARFTASNERKLAILDSWNDLLPGCAPSVTLARSGPEAAAAPDNLRDIFPLGECLLQ